MTIDGSKYMYDLVCDVCGDYARETFDDFYDAVEYKRENGWESRKDENDEWMDICPVCLDEDVY